MKESNHFIFDIHLFLRGAAYVQWGRNAKAVMLITFLFLGGIMFLVPANAANLKGHSETFGPETIGQNIIGLQPDTIRASSNPQEPSYLNTSRCDNCSVNVMWTAPMSSNGLTGYNVQVSDSKSFENVLRSVEVGVDNNTITITDLSKGAEYYFRVQGLFNGTEGPFSASVNSESVIILGETNAVDTDLIIATALVVALIAFLDFMTLYTRMRGRLRH
jgi:hypothetical protein